MTDREKAQAYDEALEGIQEILSSGQDSIKMSRLKLRLRGIFPELKESEDEKIRKVIYGLIYTQPSQFFDNGFSKEEMLAWLEKQGCEPNWCHYKVDLSNCSEEYRKAYYDGWNNCNMQHSQCKSESNDVVKCLINGMKFYYEDNEDATWGTEKFSMKVKDILSWLEKQGEQKNLVNGDIVKTIKERIIDHFDNHLMLDSCFSIGELKNDILRIVNEVNQGEQKFHSELKEVAITEPEKYCKGVSAPIEATAATYTTEVETGDGGIKALVTEKVLIPKYKVGDWIADCYCRGRVVALTDDAYLLDSGQGIPFSCEDNIHLWTIQDAKDGDVLVDKFSANSIIILFKSINPKSSILAHCGYNNYNFSVKTNGLGYGSIDNTNYYPANKEQRVLLFQKMKEAGWEWDAEKKELKKIE